jgi:alpha-methylacyl-CoA racemase
MSFIFSQTSGARYIASWPLLHSSISSPLVSQPRGYNLLDGGAPFYAIYTTKDDGWMSVGCLEPQFFKVFIERFVDAIPVDCIPNVVAEIEGYVPKPADQANPETWGQLKKFLEDGFRMFDREYWTNVFHGNNALPPRGVNW